MSTGLKGVNNRIALFVPVLTGGGAERVMVDLAGGFARRGLPVDLVLVQASGPYLAAVPAQVRIVELRSSRTTTSALALASYLRRERPLALLSTLHLANVVAIAAKRLAGVETRAVVRQSNTLTVGSGARRRRVSRLISFLVRKVYPWADGIVAVSQAVAEDLTRVTRLPGESITVIPNPVVTAELFQLAKESPKHPWFEPGALPVVLGVGRFTRQKDFPTLLHAFARVQRLRPCRLVLLGEGKERPALERLSRELGVQHAVSLPGFVSNPFAFMARAAVFASSSAWEGLPGALIQALACGAPCVATDCPGGSREVLGDGRFGSLVPVGDVSALAASIAAMLERPRPKVADEAWSRFSEADAVDGYLRALHGELRVG
jgi:glycosyltransferase involved in cell wall biosynthesis